MRKTSSALMLTMLLIGIVSLAFNIQEVKGVDARAAANFAAEADVILLKYKPSPFPKEPAQILEHLFLRFHSVAKQLQTRQRKRDPLYRKR
jgi:hypothetical protein